MSTRGSTRYARSSLHAAFLLTLSQGVLGHSSIDMPPPYYVREASVTASYRIVHACDGSPVIAQSFIMPSLNPVLERQDGGKIEDANGDGIIDIADISDSGSLIGTFQPLIDKRVFSEIQMKVDDPGLGNAIGVSATGGSVPDKFFADTPIVIRPVFFIQNSCAKELVVHPVAADICRFTKSPRAGDVNIWMEHPTAKFPNLVHGIGESQLRISFHRNLKANPLPKRCNGGYTVDAFASDEDIDAHLPIPGVWPKP